GDTAGGATGGAAESTEKEEAEQTAEAVDPAKPGSYLVGVSLWNAIENKASMGNVAFEGESGLVKTSASGASVLQVGTHPVAVSGYTTGVVAFQYDIGNGYTDATVKKSESFTTNTKYDGTAHTITCIRVFEIELSNTTATYVPVRIRVPYTPMDAVAVDGEGWLHARLKIDWSSATDAGGLSQLEATPTPEEAITDAEAEDIALSDAATGVKLTAAAGVVPEDAELSVKAVTSGTDFTRAEAALKETLQAEETPKFKLYDISLLQSKVAVQPSGTITLSVPIPADYDKTKVVVYRINDDGTATLIKGKVVGDDFEIALNRLSFYALVEGETVIEEPETPLAASVFTDIDGHWAREAILYVTERGLFNGTSETTFGPNVAMDRGMFVTVLGRLAGMDEAAYTSTPFTDVAAGAYYAAYAAWASEKGIAGGVGDGLFAPSRPITRQEMATMLHRYMEYAGIPLGGAAHEPFADDAAIASWAKDGVYALAAAGLLNGMGENTYAPTRTATRAEVATVLMRLAQGYES
ncbi:MAG: S-layer homology domain-containing protein, partial [Clostridiales Family XIII bacterium]|nr:S-layer homology domain-containing protein [Clostridiales Family XIII bacterium]